MHRRLASDDGSARFQRRSSPDVERQQPQQQATNSAVFRGVLAQPHVQPHMHPGTMVSWSGSSEPSLPSAAGLVETRFPPYAGGNAKISGPMLGGGGMFSFSNEGRRDTHTGLRTVSLRAAAAEQERQREARRRERVSMQLGLPVTETPPQRGGAEGAYGVRRKPLVPAPSDRERERQYVGVDPRTSAFTYLTEDDDATTQYTWAPGGLAPADQADQRVLFVTRIEYDDPVLVSSLVSPSPGAANPTQAHATGRYTVTATSKGILRRSPLPEAPEDESPTLPAEMTPVIARKRPAIPDRDSNPRAIFPSERSPRKHNRSRSGSSRKSTRSQQEEEAVPPLPAPARKQKQKQAPAPLIIADVAKSSSGGHGPPRSAVAGAMPLPITPALPTPYETAKAWVESMAPVIKNSGPVLVDISSRKSALLRSTSEKSQKTQPEPEAIAAMPSRRPSARRRSSATLAGVGLGLGIGIGVVDVSREQEHEHEHEHKHQRTESIIIELRNSMSFDSDVEEEGSGAESSPPSLTTAASSSSSPQGPRRRRFPSPASAILRDYDYDFTFSGSPPSPSSPSSAGSAGSGSIIFTNLEAGIELSDLQQAVEQQQQQAHGFLSSSEPESQRRQRQFRLGDTIPAFSTTFRGGSQRRKPAPAPLGTVPLRPLFARFPRPPTFQQSQQAPAPAPAPNNNNRGSVLLRQLEQETSAQENEWQGLRRTLVLRDSLVSASASTAGMERATARTSDTTDTTTAVTSAGGWQTHLARAQAQAQLAGLADAPVLARMVEEAQRGEEGAHMLEPLGLGNDSAEQADATPLQPMVYFNSAEDADATPLQPTVYFNPTLELGDDDDEEDEDDDYGDDEEDEDEDKDEVHVADMDLAMDMMGWELISSVPRAAPASLWVALVGLPHIASTTTTHLWSARSSSNVRSSSGHKTDGAAVPAALTLRPRKRFDRAPSSASLQSSRLWAKATATSRIDDVTGKGLWKGQNGRTTPTPTQKSSLRKRDSTGKKRRVTWVEDVVTGLLAYTQDLE